MTCTIAITPEERNVLLDWYRQHSKPNVRLRCHIILLLADGHTWAAICDVLFCSTRTISRWKERFEDGRVEALLGRKPGRVGSSPCWIGDVLNHWVQHCRPTDFGWLRSRWCCWMLAWLLADQCDLSVSTETLRRWLHREGLVWRRPRPVIDKQDPEGPKKLRAIRQVLRHLGPDEVAVFQDEVDLNLNPEIGSCWMRKGQQSHVQTPGNNHKRYLAGSLDWRTGEMISTLGPKRNGDLFVAHLDDLVCELGGQFEKIHVILDNAPFHDCKQVNEWLALHGQKIELHFLPKYSPKLNPIERVWWHLREQVTRNHTCREIEELIELTLLWLWDREPMEVEGSAYEDLKPKQQ